MGMLDDFRAKNPAYANVPDQKLADGLYNKYYADKMDRNAFNEKVGFSSAPSGSPVNPKEGVFKLSPEAFQKFTQQRAPQIEELKKSSLPVAENTATIAATPAENKR